MTPSIIGSGTLEDGVAHACIVPLDADPQTVRHMYAVLSPEERVRAARFAFDRDRRTFVMSHGILRRLLGAVCQTEPAALRFRHARKGKPFLVDAPDGIQFNLSHCERFCLVGIGRGAAIGVDVEQMREMDDMLQLVRQCFSAAERRQFEALPTWDRCRAFFNGWTRKEAFIKAVGDGLSYPLERFDVTLGPGGPARLLAIDGSTTAAAMWTLETRDAASDVVAAIAVAAPAVTVRWHVLSNISLRTQTEDVHGGRGTRRHNDLSRGDEPRRTVLNLAGGPGSSRGMARGRQERSQR
jgi:4'-phosphopantetheinyl transferase